MPNVFLTIDWSFFSYEFMDEKISNYLWCVGIILATLLVKKPMALLLTRVSSQMATRFSYLQHKEALRNMLFKPVERLLQVVFYFIALNQLDHLLDKVVIKHSLGNKEVIKLQLNDVLNHIFLFLFIVFLTQVVAGIIDFIYHLRLSKARSADDTARIQLLPLMKEMAKLVLWALSLFWILGSVFHVNVPALITGLGIGGVAIALAGKETVENFFAAFTILSDKPFQTGESIKLGDIEGVVERIGFRSTRLRNVDGSAYIIPNQNLVSQNLINLSLRSNRLIKVVANMRYGITQENLELLIAEIRESLKKADHVMEPVEATIETFDKETFQLVISYFLPHPLPPDVKLTSIKREINMKIFGIVQKHGEMGMPYPMGATE